MKLFFRTVVLFLYIHQLSAQNCYEDFNFYRPVTLRAETGQTIPSGTVAIPFDTKALFDAGKIAGDGSNLRITDVNCQELPFYVQDVPSRNKNVLYVYVPEIDATGIVLQLYYGSDQTQASVINGEAVFLFFDDFEDGEVDWTNWEVVGHEADILEEIDGELHFTGTFGTGGVFKYAAPQMAYTSPVTFDFVTNANNSVIYGVADAEEMKRLALRYSTGATIYDTLDIIAIVNDTLNGGFESGIPYPNVKVPRNDMNIISISSFLDDENHLNFTGFRNYSTDSFNSDTATVTQTEFTAVRPFFASFSIPNKVAFLGIREDVGGIPTIEYGAEEMLTATDISVEEGYPNITVYPNPTPNQLTIKGITEANVIITNNTGKIIKKTVLLNQMIDISGLPVGIYYIKIITPLKLPITRQLIKW